MTALRHLLFCFLSLCLVSTTSVRAEAEIDSGLDKALNKYFSQSTLGSIPTIGASPTTASPYPVTGPSLDNRDPFAPPTRPQREVANEKPMESPGPLVQGKKVGSLHTEGGQYVGDIIESSGDFSEPIYIQTDAEGHAKKVFKKEGKGKTHFTRYNVKEGSFNLETDYEGATRLERPSEDRDLGVKMLHHYDSSGVSKGEYEFRPAGE